MKKTTQKLTAAITLTGSYQYLEFDASTIGSLAVNMRNQVVLSFVRASGSTITFVPNELNTYKNGSGVEEIGWTPVMKDDGAGTLTPSEFTSTEASFSFSFSTMADNIRIGVKGTGVYSVYASVAKVQ
jgi:hypothetical protein